MRAKCISIAAVGFASRRVPAKEAVVDEFPRMTVDSKALSAMIKQVEREAQPSATVFDEMGIAPWPMV